MNRREVMLGLATMFGAELVGPIRAAIAAGLDPVHLTGATLFSEAARADVAALAEVIIPQTDTPGARAAGVDQFVEFMLQEWYPETDRRRFEDGLSRLDEHCRRHGGAAYAALDSAAQTRLVADLQAGSIDAYADGGKDFFEHIKQLTVFGYYTSEVGMTVERRYLPVPGRYDGAYPYDKVGTLFTS
jgi:glucoside 3-dehydrogenase (cytochrome c) hitch-hiker subunit